LEELSSAVDQGPDGFKIPDVSFFLNVFLYMFSMFVIILYINIYIFHNVCIVFASIFLGIEAEEGSVHCYDGLPEASGPVWSGSSFSAD